MNDLVNNVQTMTHLEIAKVCGKEPHHISRDIGKMLSGLNLDSSKFGYTYKDSLNRDQKGYKLDKDLTLTLVSGYDVKARYEISKFWNAQDKPMTPAEQLHAQSALLLEHERQLAQIPILTDKVEKLEAAKEHTDHLFHFGEYTSIKAYCNVHSIRLDLRQSGAVGRYCSTLCREKMVSIKKLPCPLFGQVNAYPEDIIEQVLINLGHT